MVFVILAIWLGYKKARDTGRNKFLWATIAGAVYVGIQLVVSFSAGILIGLGQQFWGWDENAFDTYGILITVVAIVLSVAGVLVVFKYLDRLPDDGRRSDPPPPPTFGTFQQ